MLKEHGERTRDGRWRSGAADRNWQAISEIVAPLLPNNGTVVEIASGTGQHIVRFAEAYPHLQWQPTEPDEDLRQSILKEIELSGLGNIGSPLSVNVGAAVHDLPRTKLILCVNMLHVSAYESIQGLISCASLALSQSGHLYIYGPFKHNGEFNSEGNQKFDETLRANRPEWGLREITDVIDTAKRFNFLLEEKLDMPANNTSLIFRLKSGNA